MTPPSPWSHRAADIDRFLDGEAAPEERSALEADLARDPVLRARVARRRAFLAAVSRGREAQAHDGAALASLEVRVRSALAADRAGATVLRGGARPRWTSWAAAAAAVLLLAVGLSYVVPVLRPAEAVAPEALLAAELVRSGPATTAAVGTCAPEEPTSPFRFPLVTRHELGVKGCWEPKEAEARQGDREHALLYRVSDLEVVGYVAVPDPNAPRTAPRIGVTRLADVVVFDVRIGGAAYYLALRRDAVDRHGTCAACHGSSREGEKNPHLFEERRVPAGR